MIVMIMDILDSFLGDDDLWYGKDMDNNDPLMNNHMNNQ